jgi:hypothetical protein
MTTAPPGRSANPYATYVDLDAPQEPRDANPPQPPPPPPPYGYAPPVPPPPPVAYFAPMPPKRSRPGLKLLVATAVLLVAGGGGVAYGADAYAKSKICDEIAAVTGDPGTTASDRPAAEPATAEPTDSTTFRSQIQGMRRSAKLLVFDPKLKSAVEGLADDAEDALTLRPEVGADPTDTMQRAILLAGRIDGHVRTAQQACGQRVTGITGQS